MRYLTFRERKAREQEKDWIGGILNQPAWALKDLTSERRGNLVRRRNHLEDDLEENAPPTDLSGATKNSLYQEQKEIEAQIRDGMPTVEVMRRNPPGAVDMHIRWETRNKDRILRWKNLKRLQDPDNEEKDFTNVEMLRPSGITQGMATDFMMGAQIPGHFSMTPLAKANWPENMPEHGTVDSPMKHAEREEIVEAMVGQGLAKQSEVEELKAIIKELQAQVADHADKKSQKKANQDAARERMKKYWAKKNAAKEGTSPPVG